MRFSTRPGEAPAQHGRRGLRELAVWVWILGFCLAALIATYVMFVEPPPPRKIVIASGGQDGAYFHYAQKYAEELQKEGLSVEVRETAGSVENLRLLGRRIGCGVAIVQSGVAAPRRCSNYMPWAACTASPCGSFTAATSGLIASVSSRANVSVSVRRAAAPTPSPCVTGRQRPDRIQVREGKQAGCAGPGERR